MDGELLEPLLQFEHAEQNLIQMGLPLIHTNESLI